MSCSQFVVHSISASCWIEHKNTTRQVLRHNYVFSHGAFFKHNFGRVASSASPHVLAACSLSDTAADAAGFPWGFWVCLFLSNDFPFWKLWLPLPNSSLANFCTIVLEFLNSARVPTVKRNRVKNDWITSEFCCVHLETFLCFCAISHSVSLLSICLSLSSLSICCSLSFSCPTARL